MNVVIVGAQWGDEGKGKIVDLFTEFADGVVRFQGGANAGHTLVVGGEKTVLHLIPSGILHPGKRCFIGSGVVVDPESLVQEVDLVKAKGHLADDAQLCVSLGAHVIMPYHKRLDRLREQQRGAGAIGTTGRGIGPCYEDKVARRGVRIADLLAPEALTRLVRARLPEANAQIVSLGGEALDEARILNDAAVSAARLRAFAGDVSAELAREMERGKSILFEGAQGTLLDVDHGTYPFVTSSNTVAGNAAVGAGVGPTQLHQVIGISKAYTTRVGAGPFPTELSDALGDRLRTVGQEFGATTGRPRRCGWFDALVVRYAARVNGLSGLALTKLDVLSGIDPIRICVGYRVHGRELRELTPDVETLSAAEPIYEDLAGWRQPLRDLRSWEELPVAARRYVQRIEQLTGVEVAAVSIGAERGETIIRRNPFRKN